MKSLPGRAASARCQRSATAWPTASGVCAPLQRLEVEPQVLGHQRGAEAGVVGAGQDPVGELVGRGRVAPGRGVEHVEHHRQRQAMGQPEGERFGGRGQCGGGEEVVEQLHGLALPGVRADGDDVAGEGLEHRSMVLQDRGGTRVHERERPPAGSGHPTRHRSVDVGHPDPGEPRGRLDGRGRARRREIDHGRRPPVGDRRDGRDHVQHHGAVRQAEQHRVGPSRHLVEGGRGLRAGREPLGRARGVEADEREARGGDPLGHRSTHVAQADEADDPGRHRTGSGVMPSASSTRRARRNASTPAGTPA